MGSADLGDVHLQVGMLADERPGGARVVEVDVGEQEMADVLELVAALRQPVLQSGDTARGAAVVEGEAVAGLDEVDPDHLHLRLVPEVDRFDSHRQTI
jgi:hypothetical protein